MLLKKFYDLLVLPSVYVVRGLRWNISLKCKFKTSTFHLKVVEQLNALIFLPQSFSDSTLLSSFAESWAVCSSNHGKRFLYLYKVDYNGFLFQLLFFKSSIAFRFP